MTDGKEKVLAAAQFADEIGAEDIVILDLQGISNITDFFMICTGTSTPHLKAIRRDVFDKVVEHHEEKPHASDGNIDSQWIVMDYGDVMIHIFHKEKRDYYSLEDLWSDAPHVPFVSAAADLASRK